MKNFIQKIITKYQIWIIFGLVCFAIITLIYGGLRLFFLRRGVTKLVTNTEKMQTEITDINGKIASLIEQSNALNETVQNELVKSDALADQVEQVSDTASALKKLSKVDPQLLQKYSKVYFLNEHYEPKKLVSIPAEYRYEEEINYKILDGVAPYLKKMWEKAKSDGIDLRVASAYRSFDDQAALKSSYQVVYGAGTANQFSADQGYSEHQLGTTIDFTTPETNGDTSLFDQTEAFKWLEKNAYRYGFVMSYPKNNSYYVYEPWHWRFVGRDLAQRLNREDEYFYDLDQRVINNYLSLFFD